MEAFISRKLRIIEPGLLGYTGPVGEINFVDGVSTTDVQWQRAMEIGASFRIEDANIAGYNISASAEVLRHRDTAADAPHIQAFARGTQDVDGEAIPLEHYTVEELEEIADKHGLAGVRDIARKWGRTGRSIQECIHATLQAQIDSAETAA